MRPVLAGHAQPVRPVDDGLALDPLLGRLGRSVILLERDALGTFSVPANAVHEAVILVTFRVRQERFRLAFR